MSSADFSASLSPEILPKDTRDLSIGIMVSRWNDKITFSLRDGALKLLKEAGVPLENITVEYVPGSYELPLGAQLLLQTKPELDAVICLGSVIQGETRHFDFICNAVSNGIMNLGLQLKKPIIFGVLTPENMQQAEDRAGGKHGNKGEEAALAALDMIRLSKG